MAKDLRTQLALGRRALPKSIEDFWRGKPVVRDYRMLPISDSRNQPIRIDWVDSGQTGTVGKLGMTLCPGRRDSGRTARYDRNLRTDLTRIRSKHEVDVIVVLIEDFEFKQLDVLKYFEVAKELDLKVYWYPVMDGSTPRTVRKTRALVDHIVRHLRYGSNVLIHCKAGLGRAGTITACTLVRLGFQWEDAIAVTRTARRGTLENSNQEAFVKRFQEWDSDSWTLKGDD
jgi:protein-tyrosine phosphatase